jgi:hypothetical protein
MISSIVFIICHSLFFGKAMKLLEFVLFNRGVLFSLDGSVILLA